MSEYMTKTDAFRINYYFIAFSIVNMYFTCTIA